jgi:hypothetical protein
LNINLRKKKLIWNRIFSDFFQKMIALIFLVLAAVGAVPLFSPVQLVRPNKDHTGFEVVKDTLAQLTSLGRQKKIALVSVVGPYHSGKSFLLNALIGQTNVFSIGPKTSPETMGLWVARTNMTLPAHRDVEVWFVDSEGFFGPQVPESYDAKTFTLSLLLGDEFVYNTVKIIDSQAVGLLEMLVRRAQLFRTKSEATDSVVGRLTPHLTWVVEDFVQTTESGESKTKWLEAYLKSDGVDQPYLKKIFPDLCVKSLFLPATSRQALSDLSKVPFHDLTAEFRSDLVSLRDSIMKRMGERSSGFISPSELAQKIQFLAMALDKGMFPQLPSLWDSWRVQVMDSSMNDAVELFDSILRSKIESHEATEAMPSVDEFNTICESARNSTLVLYSELVSDFLSDGDVSLASMLTHLDAHLNARYTTCLSTYLESIKSILREKSRQEFSKFLQQVPSAYNGQDLVEPLVLQTNLAALAVGRIEAFQKWTRRFDSSGTSQLVWEQASFPTTYKTHPVDELRMELQSQIDSLLVENEKGISNVMKSSAVTAIKSVDDVLLNASSVLMSTGELDKFNQQVIGKAVAEVFTQELGRDWMKKISPLFNETSDLIRREVQAKLNQFKTVHEERLYEWFRRNADKALSVYRDLKRSIELSMLPLDEEKLVTEHAKAVAALITNLDADLGASKFKDSSPYKETRTMLDGVIDNELQKLRRKNIELWKVHSDETTQCAFELNTQYVNLHCPQGWFCLSRIWPGAHRQRCWDHLMQCFKASKISAPSESIQRQIFESWFEKELAKEVAEVRNNMWMVLVSLLVPIAWVVYIKRS